MFETFNIPGLYIANPSVLSLYASGKITGIIVELGEKFSHFMPFFEGYSLPSSNIRQNFGGNDLTEYMVKALQEEGYNLGNKSSKLIANKIKEKACYVSLDYEKELKSVDPLDYELPDGKHVIIKAQRLTCPEILFRPDAFGIIGIYNIGEACHNSIQKCDIDIRKDLYNSIILSGGTSMFNGLPERFTEEVKNLVSEPMKKEVKVFASPERKFASWIGGAFLSSWKNFKNSWITKEEYEESGIAIVHKKCI